MIGHRAGRILVIALVSLFVHGCGEEKEEQRRARACGDNGGFAYSMIKKFLQAELQSNPQVAFPLFTNVRAEKPSTQDPCFWVIYGHVDVESAQGQQSRRTYIASIVYEGENHWRLNDLDLQ